MVKIQLAAPQSVKDTLLLWLQDQEVVHVSPVESPRPSEGDTAYHLAELTFALDFLQRLRHELHQEPRRTWKNFFSPRPVATVSDLQGTLERLNLPQLLKQIREVNDALAALAAAQHDTAEQLARYQPWAELALTGNDLDRTGARHTLMAVGRAEEDLVVSQLEEIPTAVWQVVSRTPEGTKNGWTYLEVVAHATHSDAIAQLITDTSAELVTLPLAATETPAARLNALQQQVARERATHERMVQDAATLLDLQHDLQFAYDALLHQQEREQLDGKLSQHPHSFVITGWVPEKRLAELTAALAVAAPTAHLESVPLADGERPPVLLDNNRWARPFEIVTGIYGQPQYHELDPSPVLSVFFLLAFGLALTDAGYGLILIVGTWAAEKWLRLKRDMRKMMQLMRFAGVATVILGALTGGWFGIVLEELPPSMLRDALLAMKLIDPISQPMQLLGVAFAIGIIQLLFAWVVRGYDHYRRRDFVAFWADDMAWVSMVAVLLAWIAARQGILPPGATSPLQVLVWINVSILVVTQGRLYQNIALRLGAGALSLYGLVSFMSDMLSYSRLLALGLATGIIGLVVNLLGSMVAGSIPVVGWVLAALVLVVGHTFNLGINTLGAFIHSGRLQFVEFFPKFIEGGGVAFRPFGRVSQYVDNPRDFSEP